jgi:Holliday junction resolvase RusA-like endonuclease
MPCKTPQIKKQIIGGERMTSIQMDENLPSIEFTVDSFPPAYDSGFSISNKAHSRHYLVAKLQEKAKEIMKGKTLFQGALVIELKIEATIEHNQTDTVNLLSGVANSLQGIVYTNDNQIKEIHAKNLLSNKDRYSVRISKVGQY